MSEHQASKNTDRELWRGPDEGGGDFYADSLHITKEGALGIHCGGLVYVKSIREWHSLAGGPISVIVPERALSKPDDITAPIIRTLRWNSAFGANGNISERAADNIENLCSCLEELARSADTAELLLKRECPGEAASLRAKVGAAINLLTKIRCTTCHGFGFVEELGGGNHKCAGCAPAISLQKTQPAGNIEDGA